MGYKDLDDGMYSLRSNGCKFYDDWDVNIMWLGYKIYVHSIIL